MRMLLALFAALLLTAASPQDITSPTITRAADDRVVINPYAGIFEGDGIVLKSRRSSDNRRFYTGMLEIDGREFTFRAEQDNQALLGAFNAGGETRFFSAAPDETAQKLDLEIERERTELLRTAINYQPDADAPAEQTIVMPRADRLRRVEHGFEAAIPEGFRILEGGEDGYLLGSGQVPGILAIIPNGNLTEDSLATIAESGYLDPMISVTPTGEADTLQLEGGAGISIPVAGQMQGREVIGRLGVFAGDDGQGLLVLGAAQGELWPRLAPYAEFFLTNFQFIPLDMSAISSRWELLLKGKKLSYLNYRDSEYGSYNQKIDLHLCEDGAARRVLIEGTTGAETITTGRWAVTVSRGKAQLQLTLDGETEERPLELLDGKTHLGGVRWYRTTADCD